MSDDTATVTIPEPATALLARRLEDEMSMLARALLHAMDERDDPEAITWLHRRAAAVRPTESLRKIAHERERQQIAASKRMGTVPEFDAHADDRAAREAFYRTLTPWEGITVDDQ
jgi:hypothetical protein